MGSATRACTARPVPTRRTVAMLDSLRLTPPGGQYSATTRVMLSETLPRDWSRAISTVHLRLLLPPLPTGRCQQRTGMATSAAGTYRETQAKIMGKKAARGLLCSHFWLLLLGWGWLLIQACCRSFVATRRKRNTSVCRRQVSLARTVICAGPSPTYLLRCSVRLISLSYDCSSCCRGRRGTIPDELGE
jgi:hypothetical protein